MANEIAGFGGLNYFSSINSSVCNSYLQIGFLHIACALCFIRLA